MNNSKPKSNRSYNHSAPRKDFAKKPSTAPAKPQKFSNHVTRTKKLDIERIDSNFCGVAEVKGRIFHVKNVLLNERVEVELPHLKDQSREKTYV